MKLQYELPDCGLNSDKLNSLNPQELLAVHLLARFQTQLRNVIVAFEEEDLDPLGPTIDCWTNQVPPNF